MESILLPRLALPALAKLVKKEDGVKVIEGPKNGRNDVVKLFFKIGDNTFFGTRLLLGNLPGHRECSSDSRSGLLVQDRPGTAQAGA